MKKEFKNQLLTGIYTCPILYIPHYHYSFIDEVIQELCNQENPPFEYDYIMEYCASQGVVDFITKNPDEGLTMYTDANDSGNVRGSFLLSSIVQNSKKLSDKKIFIFKEYSEELCDKRIQRLLLTFAEKYEQGIYAPITTLIFVSPTPVAELPPSLLNVISIIEIIPPSTKEIEECVNRSFKKVENDSYKSDLCRTLQGLQLYDIRQILRTVSHLTHSNLDRRAVDYGLKEKKRIVKKNGIIDVIETNVCFKDIGGLDVLREEIEGKKVIFEHLTLAKDVELPLPKGILLIGMPGCGKSMVAEAIANEFDVSLLRLDISRLMDKFQGKSEENLRKALSLAEAAHPCVLWIDEIEKAFHGANNIDGENSDSVMRMMAHFLTWMQERKSAVYIVATANDVMRPEFMRKGRFDDVFFLDFPNKTEREAIFRTQISRYDNTVFHFSLNNADYEKMAEETSGKVELNTIIPYRDNEKDWKGGFSGAEIKNVIDRVVEKKFKEYSTKKDRGERIKDIIIDMNTDIIPEIQRVSNSVMCNQIPVRIHDGQTMGQKPSSFENIMRLQALNHFKSASK